MAPLAVVFATFVAYLPALFGGFVWDDSAALHENTLLRTPSGLIDIWTTHGLIPNESHYWPVIYTFYWIEYHLWGLHPLGYHAVNILLHAANSILLLHLARRMKIPGAWMAAAIFALHPVHVESVAWIHEFKDVISACFYLLAFHLYLTFDSKRHPGVLVGVLVLVLLGMLSKTVVVTFPAALLIYLWARDGHIERRHWVPVTLIATVAFAAALIDVALVRRVEQVDFGRSLVEKGLLAGRALVFYLHKLAWPMDLAIIYPSWEIDAASPKPFLYPAVVVGLALLLWALRSRIGRLPLACCLFYFVTLSPMLGIVDFSFMQIAFVADRFQYLASAGICLLAGSAIHLAIERCRRSRRRPAIKLGYGLFALLMMGLGLLTWRQAALYKDIKTLFTAAVERNPNSPEAHVNLGSALFDEGSLDAARLHFEEALRIRPDYLNARSNLGLLLARQGDDAGAVREYRYIAERDIGALNILNDLAWLLATSTDPGVFDASEALTWANLAAEGTNHSNAAVLDTLATAQAAAGERERAVKTYARALGIARLTGETDLATEIEMRMKSVVSDRGSP